MVQNKQRSFNVVQQVLKTQILQDLGWRCTDMVYGVPCNMHINDLASLVCEPVDENELKSVLFNTITILDGISMGTLGMRYSLVSREVIADSIEKSLDANL